MSSTHQHTSSTHQFQCWVIKTVISTSTQSSPHQHINASVHQHMITSKHINTSKHMHIKTSTHQHINTIINTSTHQHKLATSTRSSAHQHINNTSTHQHTQLNSPFNSIQLNWIHIESTQLKSGQLIWVDLNWDEFDLVTNYWCTVHLSSICCALVLCEGSCYRLIAFIRIPPRQ